MEKFQKYFDANKESWNKRTIVHKGSAFYGLKDFKAGKSSLTKIELDEMGEVKGKSLLHLQCHFGMDTMSWSRLGAKCVGVDLSDEAIKTAKEINDELGLDAKFVSCNVYDLHVAGLILEPEAANPNFIFLWALHEYVRTRSGGRGGAQPALNGAIVRSLKVPLPPLAEQARIITRVAQLRRLCADLRQRLAASQSTQAHLAEALVENVA